MLDFIKIMEDELKSEKYYDVVRRSDDLEYKHLKLIEMKHDLYDSVLYFIKDDGHKIIFQYSDILAISESKEKEKEEPYSESLYFKDKMIHIKVKKYCVKERIQKNFYLAYNNCVVDGIEWIENVPHLRVFTRNDQVKYINMLLVEDIKDAE